MDSWLPREDGDASLFGMDRRWVESPPRPPKMLAAKFLAVFDEASWRIKAAWAALRHGREYMR